MRILKWYVTRRCKSVSDIKSSYEIKQQWYMEQVTIVLVVLSAQEFEISKPAKRHLQQHPKHTNA
jgi:hypothetical protein